MKIFLVTLTGFLSAVGITTPANAQFFPLNEQPLRPENRPVRPEFAPFPPNPFTPVETKTCNPGEATITVAAGIPNDTTNPPRIGKFSIPAKTCLIISANGQTRSEAYVNLQNSNIFDLCNPLQLRSRSFTGFGNRFVLECRRTDSNRIDRRRIRGQNPFLSPDRPGDLFFDRFDDRFPNGSPR
jgi:hypothetical protein